MHITRASLRAGSSRFGIIQEKSDDAMTVYNWLCLLGVPALLAAVVKYLYQQIKSVKMGVQALLRAQMITDYNKYTELGYAPIYARQNFENCWKQYHSLGANGVMDDLHTKFLQLPTERTETHED